MAIVSTVVPRGPIPNEDNNKNYIMTVLGSSEFLREAR